MMTNISNLKEIKNIFYINLESRPDRKTHFEKEIHKIGLRATRFNAIKQKSGALGCSMSHLALLKYAKNNNLDHILIMEDDICFLNPEVFMNSFNSFLSNNIDFDVLLIAGNNMESYTKINDFCVKIQKCQTTTGYLVKQNYYDKLIENIEAGIKKLLNNITRTNDYAVDQYWSKLQKIDKWFLLTPLTVTQKPDYSNVEKCKINYNRFMLDLDKKHLIHVWKNKTKINVMNIFNDIILNKNI
jgi:glycosyl transferase family 25